MQVDRQGRVDERDQAATRTDEARKLGEIDEYRHLLSLKTRLASDPSILG
jgi:hypothetical protein